MRKPLEVVLTNSHFNFTRHVFVRVQEGEFTHTSSKTSPAYLPIFRCQDTGEERVYGCLSTKLTKGQLTRLFGPLGDDLCAPGENAASAREAA